MNINEYREQFAAYNSALELARFRHRIGSDSEFRADRIRADYADLFSPAALTDLQSQFDETRAEAETESVGLRGLLGSARLEYVELQASETTRELAICESSVRLDWNGQIVSPESISFHLASEPGKTRRDELAGHWSDAVSTCDDLRGARLQVLHNAASTLGFGSYCDLVAEATRTNLLQLQLDAEALLKQTEEAHRQAISTLVAGARPSVTASDLNFADWAYLERLPWQDNFFSLLDWSRIYAEMMNGLGIRVHRQPNIQITRANSSLRDPPAACFPVNPPDDVRLVLSPRKGAYDFIAAFHAAGLAQQYGWCSNDLARRHPEFIYSQDLSTNEGFGYLFSFLLQDPKWIQEFLQPVSADQASKLAYDVTSLLSLRVRQLAAEVLYARVLHGEPQRSPEQLQTAFVDFHDRATAFRFRRELFLINLHERISSAGRLRALAFGAGFREYLRLRYGNRWWASRKAGDELIDLWNTASRYSVEELARLIGFGEISFDLIAELLIVPKSGA